jgi:aarF domain-containing kinase
MTNAHVTAGLVIGEPFAARANDGDADVLPPYDFAVHGGLTRRVSRLAVSMLEHRLVPPPQEAYSLHRRLSGAILANMRLGARVPCRRLLDCVWDAYGDPAVARGMSEGRRAQAEAEGGLGQGNDFPGNGGAGKRRVAVGG